MVVSVCRMIFLVWVCSGMRFVSSLLVRGGGIFFVLDSMTLKSSGKIQEKKSVHLVILLIVRKSSFHQLRLVVYPIIYMV